MWLWSWAVCATAALPLASAFGGPLVLPVLLVSLVVPFVVVGVGARLRLPTWVLAWATMACVLLAGLTVLRAELPPPAVVPTWRDSPAGELLGPLLDSVAHLLTGPVPVPVQAATVVPVAVLSALVALGVALATSHRSAPGVGPLVGGVVLYGAGLLLTAGAGDASGLIAVVLVAVVALGWLVLDPAHGPRTVRPASTLGRVRGRMRTRWSSATLASGLVVVVLASMATVGPAMTSRPGFEPRTYVRPPVQDLALGHPLPELAVWATRPDQELFRVTGDVPERMSLVVLPDFDGASWRADVSLRAVGSVVEAELAPGRAVGRMDAQVTVTGLADPALAVGGWLPTAGRVIRTDVPGALTDPATGSLLTTAPLTSGDTYALQTDVDQPAPADLHGAGVPSRAEAARYLALPRMPVDLGDYARQVTAGSGSRLEQVVALQDVVRGERELDPEAFSGSSYARVREVLFADAADGGQVGSSEQYAAAFAVLARAVGLPTRLVLGFVLPPAGDEGEVVVRAGDAYVWPEVYLSGPGWVAVDPAPTRTGAASGPRELIAEAQELTDPVDSPDLAEDPVDLSPDPGGADRPAQPEDPVAVLPVVLTALTTAGAALLVVLLVLVVRRRRRTLRLRRAGSVGAWQHVHDALVLRGTPPPRHESAPVLAARLEVGPVREVVAVAERAEVAAFGPRPASGRPAADGVAGREDADWEVARRMHRELRRRAGLWRRVTWWWRGVGVRR